MHVSFRPYTPRIQPQFRGGTLSANQLALKQALSTLTGITAEKAEEIISVSNIPLGSRDVDFRPFQVGELEDGMVYVVTRMNQPAWTKDTKRHYQVFMGMPPALKPLSIFSASLPDKPIEISAWNALDNPGPAVMSFSLSSGELAPRVNGKSVKDWLVILQ